MSVVHLRPSPLNISTLLIPGRRSRSGKVAVARVDSETPLQGHIPLGKSDLKVSAIGIGTLAWGDPRSGFGSTFSEQDISDIYDTVTSAGINFFDSAEVYGYQSIPSGASSEQLLAKLVTRAAALDAPPPVIATKFFTIPWTNLLVGGGFRLGRQSLIAALRASLVRLGRERVDLYQIHFPFPTFSNAALMDGLKEAVQLGLTSAVGVSNYSTAQMEEAHELLGAAGIPLASNQVRFSLLDRNAETSGLLQSCQDRGISLIAYSPLATGQLSKPAGREGKLGPLVSAMESVGESHGGKSLTQVALNYLVCKGCIPIPGCKSVEQAKGIIGSLGWSLTRDEVLRLEEAADQAK